MDQNANAQADASRVLTAARKAVARLDALMSAEPKDLELMMNVNALKANALARVRNAVNQEDVALNCQ